jgi:TRAP-type C4-dicarboxylate transport system substrate-binding protein
MKELSKRRVLTVKKLLLLALMIVFICSTLMASAGLTSCGGAKEVSWTFQHTEPNPEEFAATCFADMAKRISERTDGKFQIRIALGKELGIDRADIPEAVTRGDIEGGYLLTSVAGGIMPHVGVLELPYLCNNLKESAAVEEAINDITTREMEKLGFIETGYIIMPPQDWLSKDPVENMADLTGHKVRVWRDLDGELIKKLGGEPVYMPSTEIYLAMQRGVVDAANTGVTNYVALALYEVGKSYYDLGFAPAASWLIWNKEKFEALPEEYQTILREETKATEEYMRANLEQTIKDCIAKMAEEGCTINYLSENVKAEIRSAAKPLWEEWASRGAVEKETLEAARKALGY